VSRIGRTSFGVSLAALVLLGGSSATRLAGACAEARASAPERPCACAPVPGTPAAGFGTTFPLGALRVRGARSRWAGRESL